MHGAAIFQASGNCAGEEALSKSLRMISQMTKDAPRGRCSPKLSGFLLEVWFKHCGGPITHGRVSEQWVRCWAWAVWGE